LGTYIPPFWKCWKIGQDLTDMTRRLGLVPLDDPRHPAQAWTPWNSLILHAEVKRWTPSHPKGAEWHQDGDQTPGSRMDHALVLWSTRMPTQVRDKEGRVWTPQTYEVIIFKNLSCAHRRPPEVKGERFTFRQRVEVPKHMELP
jgi:hypothetical protein